MLRARRTRGVQRAPNGAAMLVPLMPTSAESLEREELTIDAPGANTVRHFPMLEKLAMASLSVDAPTVMAEGAEQGLMVQASAPRLFPAAVTTVMPAADSASTASLSDAERGPASDMVITADEMRLRTLCSLALQGTVVIHAQQAYSFCAAAPAGRSARSCTHRAACPCMPAHHCRPAMMSE